MIILTSIFFQELGKEENIPRSSQLPHVDEDLLETNMLNEAEVAENPNGLTDLYWVYF